MVFRDLGEPPRAIRGGFFYGFQPVRDAAKNILKNKLKKFGK